jgi:hypothetical protein
MAAVGIYGVWEETKAVQSGMADSIGIAAETVSLVAGRSCS